MPSTDWTRSWPPSTSRPAAVRRVRERHRAWRQELLGYFDEPTTNGYAEGVTELGAQVYRRRQALVEPVFADLKFNRKIERFQRRGRSAVNSEWRLVNATHNLLKLHRHQLATAGA